MYWVAIYPKENHENDTLWDFIDNFICHVLMFLMVWIDNIFNAIKPYKRHLIIILIFSLVYITENILISLLYKPVYIIMTFKDVDSYIFMIGAILLGFV